MEEYFIIPILTAILTTFVIYIKEKVQNNESKKQKILENKLVKLYNKLYFVNLRYYERLSHELAVYDINVHQVRMDLFDKAIEETREIIQENIHLLKNKDIVIWSEVEGAIQEESFLEHPVDAKYKMFVKFLSNASESYEQIKQEYFS